MGYQFTIGLTPSKTRLMRGSTRIITSDRIAPRLRRHARNLFSTIRPRWRMRDSRGALPPRARSIQLRHAYQGEPLSHRRATRWIFAVANDGDSGVYLPTRTDALFLFPSFFFFFYSSHDRNL